MPKTAGLTILLLIVALTGCSRLPDASGIYVRKGSIGSTGSIETEWDFRSDGTARYRMNTTYSHPVQNGNITQFKQRASGKWSIQGGELVFDGTVTTSTVPSVKEHEGEEPMAAKFRIEPNGDLISVSGDAPWVPDDRWYPVRYAKQR